MTATMTRRQRVVLAALASSAGAAFAPVQVQKLFFLLDENVAKDLGGRLFEFEPHNYGPFDKAVYSELEVLARRGLVHIHATGSSAGNRVYMLTPDGQRIGEQEMTKLPERAKDYIRRAAKWVLSLPFSKLVGSIYKAYPHMRANSIFVD